MGMHVEIEADDGSVEFVFTSSLMGTFENRDYIGLTFLPNKNNGNVSC